MRSGLWPESNPGLPRLEPLPSRVENSHIRGVSGWVNNSSRTGARAPLSLESIRPEMDFGVFVGGGVKDSAEGKRQARVTG
jgi:hypothetical protein